jgi:DNA recombination protein RmuC
LVVVLQVALFFRRVQIDLSPVATAFQAVERAHDRTERAVREEIAKNREESSNTARQSREEITNTLKGVGDSLTRQLGTQAQANDQKLIAVRETVEKQLGALQEGNTKKLDEIRQEATTSAQKMREEVSKIVTDFVNWQRGQFAAVVEQLKNLTESNERRLDTVRTTLEQKLKAMQDENAKQLEEMRKTVDEKLQGTLEKRLGESFKLVSERLEAVYKGLGEMQTLATGVGDLKRVLTNVKARGTWGEVQLGRMLEEILTIDQYGTNIATKEGNERVEFAIKLPGRGDDKDEIVWLPIDAKFPVEDYQRLVEAQEQGDAEAAEAASKQLEVRIKGCAVDICSKYLAPPKTTDFGILFLPTEGLFAEVVRRPGLAEAIQHNQRVVIAGPTTLWSILNALQMGFRTLAIQQRSSEVWNLLAAVKTEFGKYAGVLDQVKEKLRQASDKIDDVAVRSRAIGRKLKKVEELPAGDADKVLMLEGLDGEAEGDGEAG